ncbi:hypothetical protein [Actinomadura meyerae]|uniref:hypothetical protein n=1 Tax=Actinomadura meyerae TaxID=240840 RepID=UPI001177D783|nr:hypothetical protein [Actinomadura meyerae]
MKNERNWRPTFLPLRHHARITPVQDGDVQVRASVGPSGEVIALWSAAPDVQAVTSATTQPGWATFPDPRASRPATVRVTVHSPAPTSATTIRDFPLAHPTVQPLPDGRILAVGARARWREAGPDRNAIVYSAEGTALAAETFGDGIEHVFTTATGHIWVGYFDEGVFGNYGSGGAEGPGPIGSSGIVRFSPDLKIDWHFPSGMNDPWGMIIDCYALNVGADAVWTCYYTDFPIVRVQDGTVTGWHNNDAVARALIAEGSRVALYGGYSADHGRLVAGQLSDGRWQDTREYRVVLPDGRKLPDDVHVIGRGPDLHFLTSGGDWYRLDLDDIPPNP